MLRRTLLAKGGVTAALYALAGPALAQAPMRIVVGFAAGGPGDILARFVAEQLKRILGETVIVENRPGAAGRIATNFVRGAEPDGATMLNSPASLLTLLPHAVKGAEYNPLQDLVPVAALSDLDFALVVNAKVAARSLGEYLQLCKSDPQVASFGTAGAGTPQHMMGMLLGKAAGVALTHVPYRGGAPALQDVIGGTLPAAIGTLSDLMITARNDGRIRILAVGGAKRSAFLADVPTVGEAGIRGVVVSDCTGILLPARSPAASVARLGKALTDIVGSPEFKAGLNKFYMEPLLLDSRAYADKLQSEYTTWGPVVKSSGFSIDS